MHKQASPCRKIYAAQMLCAYYDKTCDSRELFSSYEIAGDPGFETHIMKYDVIYLDMTGIKPYTQMYASLVPFLIKALSDEIKSAYPDVTVRDDLSATLVDVVWKAGNKLI